MVITRKFEVLNLGSTPAQVTVYPAAATISGGTFRFANGDTQNEMTTWVSISKSALTLAPHSDAALVATITVPGNAPSGEQYGVIWAQVSARGAGNVTLVSRVGIRIYLSIGPGGAAAPGFTLGTPVARRTSAGVPVVSVPVHNTGGTAVDVQGTLQLTDGPGGVSAGPFHAEQVDTLAPGQSYPATFALPAKLPNGSWQATFTMVSGLITKTETVTLSFNGAPATAAAAHSKFPVVWVAARHRRTHRHRAHCPAHHPFPAQEAVPAATPHPAPHRRLTQVRPQPACTRQHHRAATPARHLQY